MLDQFDNFHINNPGRNMPMDIFLRYFFLDKKAEYDSDARNQIVDIAYALQRYKGYLNTIASRKSSGSDHITWAARFKAFQTPDFADLFDHPSIPEHARCSVPKELFQKLAESHGRDKAFEICRTSLEKPMLTVRANTIKTTRHELLNTFQKEYKFEVENCKFAPNGIRFKRYPEESLFKLPEFKRGHFEIQDEGS